MRESTQGRRNGIQWTLWNQLDDLDFADDIALLAMAHKYTQMQDKTNQMEDSAAKLGLPVSKRKTKSMRINTTNDSPIMSDKGVVGDVSLFTYLGSIVNTNGGTDEDVKARIGKARAAFNTLIRYGNYRYNNINQAANFQRKCQNMFTLWIRNLANFEDHPKQSPNIYQQVP